jgi:hypothetical protein
MSEPSEGKSVHAPANQFLRVFSVPTKEPVKVYIRFLGDYLGILTHRHKGGPVACPGHDDCPTAVHRSGTVWKGFAPAEYFRGKPHNDYMPCVFEITERLAEILPDQGLRGMLWECWRENLGKGRSQVQAILNDIHTDDELPPEFPIDSPVCRIFHTTEIAWGVKPPLPARIIVQPTQARAPVLQCEEKQETRSAASTAEIRRILAERRSQMGLGGKGVSNGQS